MTRRQWICLLLPVGILLGLTAILYAVFGRKLLVVIEDPLAFRAWIDSLGAWGEATFVGIRTAQTVFKFIPAEPLEVGSGYAFGIWGGLFLCMLGTELGSAVILLLSKKYGMRFVSHFTDPEKLKEFSKETVYVDLGFGLEETVEGTADGKPEIISTSAFNTSYPGINFLGYGPGEDGKSDNIIVLLGQMASELESPDFDHKKLDGMINKFQDEMKGFIDAQTKLDTDAEFLRTNMKRLETYNDTLNERIVSVEKVDMEEAISTYIYQQYCYNAALKVGTNILSQSLLDFMR